MELIGRNMKQNLTIFFIIVFLSVFTFSAARKRGNEEKPFQQEHIDDVNRTIAERFSKTDCFKPDKTYLYINIVWAGYLGDVWDRSQLYEDVPNNLYSIFFRGKGKTRYLVNNAFICEEDGKLVAYVSEYGVVSCVSHYKEFVFSDYQKLAYVLVEKGIFKLFQIFPLTMFQYIGIDNEGKKYYIHENNDITITLLEDMSDEEWIDSLIKVQGSYKPFG